MTFKTKSISPTSIIAASIHAASIAALAAIAATALAAPANAGTFDIKAAEVTKGEAELGVNSTFFRGFPVNADPVRHSTEYGLGLGLTDWWKIGLKANFDKPVDEAYQPVSLGVEQLTLWKKFDKGWGVAWYSSLDLSLVTDSPDTSTSGPVFQFGTETTSLTLNPFFVRSFGPNKTKGTDFNYGWQVKHQVREGFAVGVEGYGYIPDIRNAPGSEFQEHRIGPVLYFERELKRDPRGIAPVGKAGLKDGAAGGAEGPKFQMETGVLFGLTDGTQDIALKIKGTLVY